jgi:hypothetical protein
MTKRKNPLFDESYNSQGQRYTMVTKIERYREFGATRRDVAEVHDWAERIVQACIEASASRGSSPWPQKPDPHSDPMREAVLRAAIERSRKA